MINELKCIHRYCMHAPDTAMAHVDPLPSPVTSVVHVLEIRISSKCTRWIYITLVVGCILYIGGYILHWLLGACFTQVGMYFGC